MRGGSCVLASWLLVGCGAFSGEASKPDPAAVDGGPTSTTDAGPGSDACADCTPPVSLRIFVSSWRTTGAFGGPATASAQCQTLAKNAQFASWSRFHAWLAPDPILGGTAEVVSGRTYELPGSISIGSGDDIRAGKLLHVIDRDERGAEVTDVKYAWTDLDTAGSAPFQSTDSNTNCSQWHTAGRVMGNVGQLDSKDASWAARPAGAGKTVECATSLPVYCVEAAAD